MADGRYAPSPTGALHVGNLRTALLAWLFARSVGSRFLLRIDDLDPADARPEHEAGQLADLAALGLDWDQPVLRQSERRAEHHAALERLVAAGRTYECWCTRREIRDEIQRATSAPHLPPPDRREVGAGAAGPPAVAPVAASGGATAPKRVGGGGPSATAYPGTCRRLTEAERAERRASGRPAALRLDAGGEVVVVHDLLRGEVALVVDDLVLRRNDGIPAYNLATVVDDAAQGVEEVVRGDDLLDSTPRQVLVARLLDLPVPAYAHVPLVLGPDGARLAKRHGAVSLADLAAAGFDAAAVRSHLARSLGLAAPREPVTPEQLLERFDPAALPLDPWTWMPPPAGP